MIAQKWFNEVERAFAEGRAPKWIIEDAAARADIHNEDESVREDEGDEYEDMTLAEAFFDRLNVFESKAAYCDDTKKGLREMRKFLIEVGYYRPLTKEDRDSIISTGSLIEFRLNGVPYWSGFDD